MHPSMPRVLRAAVLLVLAVSPATGQDAVSQRPVVVFETEKGSIEIEIDAPRAPLTAANFLKYVDGRFYDGGVVNRAVRPDNTVRHDVEIQVIQFQIDGQRRREQFPPIPLERTSATGLKHVDGAVSMARAGPDTATASFSIVIGDQPEMDFGGKRNPDGQGFAVFGRVIRGMDIVKAIQSAPTGQSGPYRTETLDPPIRVLKAFRKSPPAPIAIVDVSIVPMDRDRVLAGQTVVVAGGKITAMGPADTVTVPPDAQRIDGGGKFLMPGLADMHVHLAATGSAATDDEENARLAVILLAHGITTVRNMKGSPEVLALRRRIDAGELPGPRIFTTGPINGASQPGVITRRVATVAEADALVTADKAAGYDAIKLTNLPPEIYVAFLAAARREKVPVYGHVPRPVTFDVAARGGLGSAEHVIPFAIALTPPDAPRLAISGPLSLAPESADWSRFPALAATLRDGNVWVCPTLSVAQRFTSAEKRRRMDDATMRYTPPRLRNAWAADVANESTGPAPGLLDFGLTLTRRLRDAGVGLLLGTDFMNPFIVPGASLHEELALFVKAGLSPFEALRAGTRDAARFLDRDQEFGTVAVGQRGDLLLLEANPLENIANVSRRAGVMAGGRWFPEPELQRRLREAGDAFAR